MKKIINSGVVIKIDNVVRRQTSSCCNTDILNKKLTISNNIVVIVS